MSTSDQEPEPVEYPIDGVLDLHTFRPSEIKDLINEYLEICSRQGIYEVRIVHGKGTGTLRALVHAVLSRHSRVTGFQLADATRGGWGATLVQLKA